MLTREYRRVVCVHEAGHAVIYALGGATIHYIAVAPEGSESWTCKGRKGSALVDLWGVCEPSDIPLASMHLAWDDDELRYQANRDRFNSWTRSLASSMGANRGKEFLAGLKREMRLHVCGTLAGPIAESLSENREFDAWVEDGWDEPGADMALADGMARLLPYRGELEHASTLTCEALRVPKIWAHVIALADELERVGEMGMDAVAEFLPQPAKDWPPSASTKG